MPSCQKSWKEKVKGTYASQKTDSHLLKLSTSKHFRQLLFIVNSNDIA